MRTAGSLAIRETPMRDLLLKGMMRVVELAMVAAIASYVGAHYALKENDRIMNLPTVEETKAVLPDQGKDI